MWILVLIGSVGFIVSAVYMQKAGGLSFPWVAFYVKGKESGFRLRELNLLRKVAVENRLKNPTSLFWSEKTLDRCIRGTMIRFRARNREDSPEAVQFLNKLFDFRKTVELNQPKYRLGITSSRSIAAGQPIKITFNKNTVYYSKVVENMRKYLAIAYPKGKILPPGFSWRGSKINVYFWRQEDAGYFFESKVLGDYMDRKYPILHISHAEPIVRAQKRNSVRAELSVPGIVYPLRSIEDASQNEQQGGGYRCRMMDISEDGAAAIVGGKAKPGLPVKIQTHVNGEPVVLCGTVKGVSYKQNKNVSVLHVQAREPSPQMKNRIRTYVYRIFLDDGKPATIRHVESVQTANSGTN